MNDAVEHASSGSPFDSIKRTTDDGREYWSARDLMPMLGYPTWQHFAPAIDRAIASAEAQGHDRRDLFTVDLEKSGGRPREDFKMKRFACYLVAMNGDPRKSEVAAAQSYFAIQTRVAETSRPDFDLTDLTHLSLVLDAGKAALNRAVAAEAKVAELEPVAAHAEVFRSAEGLRSIGDVANDFKTHAAEAFPGVKVTHQMVWDHAGICRLIIRGNTVRHNQPTSQAISADWAKPHRVQYSTHTRGDQTTVTTRLTPRGEARLWDHLVKHMTAYGSLNMQKELTS